MKNLKQKIIAAKIEQELSIEDGVIVVNATSCDGCGTCVDICPQSAIDIIFLTNEQIKEMPFKGRLKVKIKGNKKAFINSDLCTVCGMCMKECHEFAIHKVKQ